MRFFDLQNILGCTRKDQQIPNINQNQVYQLKLATLEKSYSGSENHTLIWLSLKMFFLKNALA